MTDDAGPPRQPSRWARENARGGGGSQFAWLLPLALTALVVVLGWRLYQMQPKDVRDPDSKTRPITARGDLAADEKATIALFDTASPAVVQVTNFQRGMDLYTQNETDVPQGTGSGFVWDPQGYVVTNYHVVYQGNAFTVTFANHDVFDAEVVGGDPLHDLAVLKIDPKGKPLPALPIGESRNLRVGQKTFAIGNPFGLEQTLTSGIVSGLNRDMKSIAGTILHGVVQTDAAVNPGNSGGPLLDSAGRVIGMNTSIASPSGVSAGVGFAIPVDTLNEIVPQIIRTGRAQHAGIGITGMVDVFSRDGRIRGVVFKEFAPTSTAKAAGLQPSELDSAGKFRRVGDVVVGVDGQRIASQIELLRTLASHDIGQEVEIVYLRDGKQQASKMKLVGVE